MVWSCTQYAQSMPYKMRQKLIKTVARSVSAHKCSWIQTYIFMFHYYCKIVCTPGQWLQTNHAQWISNGMKSKKKKKKKKIVHICMAMTTEHILNYTSAKEEHFELDNENPLQNVSTTHLSRPVRMGAWRLTMSQAKYEIWDPSDTSPFSPNLNWPETWTD